MITAELLRWTAVAALRFRPSVFWSVGPRQPLVLARAAAGPGRFRSAAQR